MIERGLYYASPEFAEMVRSAGGTWNDTKHRPIVCLIKSSEDNDLYWAIPMGKLNHRDDAQKDRLNMFLSLPERDIRSCYYHIGRTTTKSIFFISDAIPITDKYIGEEHTGADHRHFIIKNPNLIAELERKLFRILAVENSDNNHFRQHITDVKQYLLAELHPESESKKVEDKDQATSADSTSEPHPESESKKADDKDQATSADTTSRSEVSSAEST